ncbi:MAG: tryptophanyl-tRNA synthetase [Parcubacteria group bacterium Gr01-1014_20]|nr:MAG: tryptophanyl-tRNA synthetase [Parcubacteria group bacterium Gr01-1014_20]
MSRPRLLSGIQPSGRLHLGNYLGALKNFVDLQNSDKYECYFFIADLHSLTEEFNPEEKAKQILELTADYLAAGLDPKKSVIFQQSQIPAHSELAFILNTITPMGELERMTQFKDKAGMSKNYAEARKILENARLDFKPGTPVKTDDFIKKLNESIEYFDKAKEARENTNAGLFTYPILMAADIILYDAKFVPTGDDQDQHLELTRALVRKFNSKFGKVFTEPQGLHTEIPRVMSLGDPSKKMSKSKPETCLFLDDSPEVIESKIKRAVTDSGNEVKFNPETKPAISNLLKIYSSLSDKNTEKLEKEFSGKTYSELKSSLAKLAITYFADYRKNKKSLLAKPSTLSTTLTQGSKKAGKIADKKILEVKKRTGLTL